MRKFRIFILVTILIGMAASACSGLEFTQTSPEETKVPNQLENKEKHILKSIKDAQDEAIENINLASEKALQTGTQQTDSTIQNAIQQIKQSAEQENTKISQQLKNVNEQLKTVEEKTQKNLMILIFMILIILIGAVLIFVFYLRLNTQIKREKTKDSGIFSQEQKNWIKNNIKDFVKIPTSAERNNAYLQQNIENTVYKYCSDNDFKELIRQIVIEILQAKKNEISPRGQELDYSVEYPSQPEKINILETKYVLFARESKMKSLVTTGTDYQRGKSLYKLILDSPDSSTAILDLCIGEEGVEDRILARDAGYLGEICDISRKTNSPKRVKVVDRGYAEKRDNNAWEVTKKIKVVFE